MKLYCLLKHKTLEKQLCRKYKKLKHIENNKYIKNYNYIFGFKKLIYSLKHIYNKFNICNSKIQIINKLFEGRYLVRNKNAIKYVNVSILKKLNLYNNNFNYYVMHLLCVRSNKTYNIFNMLTNINIYNSSFIVCPITLHDSLNINNYIYSIYYYIYLKSNNYYKSSFIGLFYYFIGLFLSLFSMYLNNNIKILYSNLVIIIKKLSEFVNIDNKTKFNIISTTTLSLKIVNILNNSLYLLKSALFSYDPCLIGVTNYTFITSGIFSKISFQNTLKTLSTIVLKEKFEWSVDTKSKVILSDFISTGSGWYRYFLNI